MSPRNVVTIGLHGSASTWVFNVVRELLCCALGEDRVLTIYADEVHQIPEASTVGDRHLVIKSHHGSAAFDEWLARVRPMIVLSIRDPRDAAISMAQRFEVPLNVTVRWLLKDCQRVMALALHGHRLLRYEDRFFENPLVVTELSAALGADVSPQTRSKLFERYRSESVRQYAATLDSLPADQVVVSERMLYHKLTQIHRGHIGDTRSGKWRQLSPATRVEITRLFAPFLRRFGYEIDPV
jgi:hypothetical protein